DKRDNYPFAKAHFETYTIFMYLSELNNIDLEEEKVKNTFKMLTVSELDYAIDSLAKDNEKIFTNFGENIFKRTGASNIQSKPRNNAVVKRKTAEGKQELAESEKQGLRAKLLANIDSSITLYQDDPQSQMIDMAFNTVNDTK